MKVVVAHGEKLVLAVALLLLAAAGAGVLMTRANLPSLTGAPQASALSSNVYLMDYEGVLSRARTNVPSKLARNGMDHPDLQYCSQCKNSLLPLYSEKCPECGATITYLEDVDKDGIPNNWEKAYGLDWHDASSATQDSDGDGLNNLAEFNAKSDPTNPVSPNVVADEYAVNAVYRPARPVMFKAVNKLAAGNVFTVYYKGKSAGTLKIDAQIKDGATPVYTLVKFTEKKTNWVEKGGMTKTRDVSELAMRDVVRNEAFTMVLGVTNYMTYIEAKITAKKDGAVTNVTIGAELPVAAVGKAAKLTALDDQRRTCVFTVGNIAYEVTPGN